MAEQEAALLEIRVLRDDNESILFRILPDDSVGGIL